MKHMEIKKRNKENEIKYIKINSTKKDEIHSKRNETKQRNEIDKNKRKTSQNSIL